MNLMLQTTATVKILGTVLDDTPFVISYPVDAE